MARRCLFFGFCFFLLCGGVLALATEAGGNTQKIANRIAEKAIILDSHIDIPERLALGWEDLTTETGIGNFDYPRAIQGGLNAAFMSIYVPASKNEGKEATDYALYLISLVKKMVREAPDKFARANSPGDIRANFKKNLISLPLGLENGSAVGEDLKNLNFFYDQGIRYITLTHSRSNQIADSSYDDDRPWKGLSPFGEKVVGEMNRLGIMIDVSHVSDEAFWDVLGISKTPVIASHSSLRYFTPGWERNMSDDMLKAMAEKGGIIMINFSSDFISSCSREQGEAFMEGFMDYLQKNHLSGSMKLQKEFEKEYFGDAGYPYATLAQLLDHFDRAVKIAGIDHVGLGSDFDGAGDTMPVGLKDVSGYPNLIRGLLDRGYSREEIEKILSGNFLRVWAEVENFAKDKPGQTK